MNLNKVGNPGGRAPEVEWSLGALGDLLWVLVPGTRKHIYVLVKEEFESAIESDREVRQLSWYGLMSEAFFWSVLRPALQNNDDVELVRQCCTALRAMLDLDSEDGPGVREAMSIRVAEHIANTNLERSLWAADPELVEILRRAVSGGECIARDDGV